MLVASVLFFLLSSGNCEALTLFSFREPKLKLETCISNILTKYYEGYQMLTYFNIANEDDELLDDIHSILKLSVVSRTCALQEARNNLAYMIIARNEDEFSKCVIEIGKESSWNPEVRFLIVIETLTNIKKVFNILLKFHVNNVVVVNGTDTAELYTYNPFDNYACGKYYFRFFELGKCAETVSLDLYPEKIVTGLRNCFFNVSCPHWPPYSKDPSKSKDKLAVLGTEQYIFHLMSEIEQFKYNFTYNYDAEMFSTVSRDMSVSGPMSMLQVNHTDVMLGGLMLTHARASMFSYVHGHLDQMDEIRIMVKKASTTPIWKNFYLEFSPQVWALLLIVFVIYTVLVTMLLKTRDRGHVVLVLLDHLFQHGPRFYSRQTVKVVFICWVWFAYLINCFYQSSLVSLTTSPSKEFQVHDEQSLNEHRIRACISTVMQKFMDVESNIALTFRNNTDDPSCRKLMMSIKTVSQSHDRFTISLYNIYLYHKEQLYDEYGQSPIYSFTMPYTKVVYAMYLYKGFPMRQRLYGLALRIREAGLSDKNLRDQFFFNKIKYKFHAFRVQTRFSITWYVYIAGVSIGCLTFLVEVASKHRQLSYIVETQKT